MCSEITGTVVKVLNKFTEIHILAAKIKFQMAWSGLLKVDAFDGNHMKEKVPKLYHIFSKPVHCQLYSLHYTHVVRQRFLSKEYYCIYKWCCP